MAARRVAFCSRVMMGWALAWASGCALINASQQVAAFTVGGSLVGLKSGATLLLQNNGKNALSLGQNGAFVFDQGLASGAAYSVSVAQQPNAQTCTVAQGSGSVHLANVRNVAVVCYDGTNINPNDGNDSGVGTNGLTVSVASDSPAVADGTHFVSLTVSVRNTAQQPISGQQVALSSSGAALTLAPSSGMTDSTGTWVGHISTTVAQIATVDVQAEGVTLHPSITFTAGPPAAAHTSLGIAPNAVQANGRAAAVLTVRAGDAYNNPVPNQTVAFQNSDSAQPPSPASASTGSDGLATSQLTSNDVGLQSVGATVGNITLQGSVRFTGPPSVGNSNFAASPNGLVADGMQASTLALLLRDAAGNAIGGQPVQLSASGVGNHFSATDGNTQSDGSFTATLTSTRAEVKTVQLNLPGNANFTAQVTFAAGPVQQAQCSLSAYPSTLAANGNATTAVTLLVTDAQGNGLANKSVSLTVTGTGNRFTVINSSTNAAGVARAQLASTTAEIKSVLATGAGFSLNTDVRFVPPSPCNGTLMLPLAPRQSTAGSGATALTVGDFNGDAQPDVAAVNAASGTVAVFLNTGNAFTALTPFAVDAQPQHLAASDLHGTGRASLIVGSVGAGSLEVFAYNGSSFVSQVRLLPGVPSSLLVAPLDADADPDLLLSSNGNLITYLQSGGTFSASTVTAAQSANFVTLATGDINNDTYPDVLGGTHGVVVPFLGSSSGALSAQPLVSNMGASSWTAVADLNSDGRLDLLSGSSYAVGNGDASFGTPRAYPGNFTLGSQPALLDLNADTHPDVAGTNGTNGLIISLGNGDGTFQNFVHLTVGPSPSDILAHDFNADGNIDFAILDAQLNAFTVVPGLGGGFFAAPSPVPIASAAAAMALGDYNNDGYADVLLIGATATFYAGSSNGAFAAPVTGAASLSGSTAAVLGDFDGNGRADLASLQPASNTVAVQLNYNPNAFASTAPTLYATGNSPGALAAADLNNDGQADLLVVNTHDNNLAVYLAGAGGLLDAPQIYAAHNAPNAVAVGHFNADGLLDVAVSNQNSNDVSIFLGAQGGASLGTASLFAAGNAPAALLTADFNADGAADLAVFTGATGNTAITLLLGNGDGSLQAPSANAAAGSLARGLTALDLNRDGNTDLAWVNGNDSTLRVAYGNGAGALSPPVTYDTWGLTPALLGSADINHDGKPDAVVVHATDPGFTVLLSAGCY